MNASDQAPVDSSVLDKDAGSLVLYLISSRLEPFFHTSGFVRKNEYDVVVRNLMKELRLSPPQLQKFSPQAVSPPLPPPSERRRHHLGRLLTSIILVRQGQHFFSAAQPGAFRALTTRLPNILRAAIADEATYETMNTEAKQILAEAGSGSEAQIWAVLHANRQLDSRATKLSAQTLVALAPQGQITAAAAEIIDQIFPASSLRVILRCFLTESLELAKRHGKNTPIEAFGAPLLNDLTIIAQTLTEGEQI
ncbi:hypothetical protein CCP2SC5_890008 [Azospirillaceae bacterium]